MGDCLNFKGVPKDLCARWSGLLVEPNPAAFQKLKMKRRKAHTSSACLSPLPRLSSRMRMPVNIHSYFDCENNDGDDRRTDCMDIV